MGKRDVELRIAQDYHDEISALGPELSVSEGKDNKQLQKEVKQKLEKFDRQIAQLQDDFPNDDEVQELASFSPYFRALIEVSSHGFMRRVTGGEHGMATKIAAGMIAKSQEKTAMNKALRLLDEATAICDMASHRFLKAQILHGMGRKPEALDQLNYVIENCENDDVYVDARKMKDEIESEKKKRCFVATAVYESPNAPEVEILRAYRDVVLMRSGFGRLFVTSYYRLSPPIARFIEKRRSARILVRSVLLDPLVRLIRRAR